MADTEYCYGHPQASSVSFFYLACELMDLVVVFMKNGSGGNGP